MRLTIKHPADFGAGILIVAAAALFLFLGRDLAHGTAFRMGPGYFPRYVAGVAIAIGLILIGKGLRTTGERLPPLKLRPLGLLLAAILFFGLSVNTLGLAITAAVTVLIASLGSGEVLWIRAILTALLLSALSSLLFIGGLGLAMPLWPVL